MRYLRHYFEEISGIEIYPLISLLIFTLFFAGLLLYVFKMKKSHVALVSAYPLELEPEDQIVEPFDNREA